MNLRPSGYGPDELPDCSTPRQEIKYKPLIALVKFYRVYHVEYADSGPKNLYPERLYYYFHWFAMTNYAMVISYSPVLSAGLSLCVFRVSGEAFHRWLSERLLYHPCYWLWNSRSHKWR